MEVIYNCNLSYTGSSPGMETAGATKILSLSKEKHGLCYTSFYGDGDSNANPAGKDMYDSSKPIKKFECVGQYQKRVFSRLRSLKKNTKGVGGTGKLTNTKIDTKGNYFGISFSPNVGNHAVM